MLPKGAVHKRHQILAGFDAIIAGWLVFYHGLEQRAAAAGQRALRDKIVREKLEEVWAYINRQLESLAETCGNKPEYYMRLIFSGGVNKMKERRSNPFNAWSHQLMKDKENGE